MEKETIIEKLRTFYKICIIPAIIFFFAALLYHKKINFQKYQIPKIDIILILLSLFFALILPILYRIYNFFSVNYKGAMNERRFINFEKMLIIISQISIYVMIVGNYLTDTKIVMLILSVVAFYSLYYYYPTSKKLNLDSRIFMPKPRGKRRKNETN